MLLCLATLLYPCCTMVYFKYSLVDNHIIMVKKQTMCILCGCLTLTLVVLILSLIFLDLSRKLENTQSNKIKPEESTDADDEFEENSSSNEDENYTPCRSFKNIRWLQDIITGECYEEGGMGPCGQLMTFYQHFEKNLSNFGFCDCDDIVEVKSEKVGCESVERPLIYFPEHDRCYTVFSQGPCLENEWLVFLDHSSTPACKPNRCLHKINDPKENEFSLQFWINFSDLNFTQNENTGKCFQTNSRAFCDKRKILKVVKNDWKPSCEFEEESSMCPLSPTLISIPTLECRPGSKLHQLGKCSVK